MINLKNVIENDFESDLYTKKITDIISYLNTYNEASFWDIVHNVGGSERRMLRLLNEMVYDNLIKYNKINNKFYISNNLIHDTYICSQCMGKTVDNKKLERVKKVLTEIWKKKPTPTLLFDQRPVTLETTLNRVAMLLSKNDVYKKNIVFLGDDDLTSIALSLMGIECNIVALDIDKRLIDFINEISIEYKLNIKAHVYDATALVPNEFIHKFDVLMTDPTPEEIPFTIFINTSVHLLNSNGVLYTSIYSSAMEKTMKLQKVICNANLYITDIISKFTEYQSINDLFSKDDLKLLDKYNINIDDNSICFTESLFRMEKTEETKTIKINYNLSDVFGKATKRVINDKTKDLTNNSDNVYLDTIYGEYQNSKDTQMTSE